MLKIKDFKELIMSNICGEIVITKVTKTKISYLLPYSKWVYDFDYTFDNNNLENILNDLSSDIRHYSNSMVDLIEESCCKVENILTWYLVQKIEE